MKTIRVRLRLTPEQERHFHQQANAHRAVWNWCCRESDKHYQETGETLRAQGGDSLANRFVAWKKQPENGWITETANATAAREAIRDFDKSRNLFFSNLKAGRGAGMPKQKPFWLLPRGFAYTQGWSYTNGRLKLGRKIGSVKVLSPPAELEEHAKAGALGAIVRITQKRCAHRKGKTSTMWWYASFVVKEESKPLTLSDNPKVIGVDIGHGASNYIITNDGLSVDALRLFDKNHKRIAKLQRRLAKKQKGSNRRKELVRRIARLWYRIHNQRDTFAHTVSNMLLERADIICMESHSLAKQAVDRGKAVHEAAHGVLRKQLEYKAQQGKIVVFIDPYYPSTKTCSKCGKVRESIPLQCRSWTCEDCGASHCRDTNAATNIAVEGVRTLVKHLKGGKNLSVFGLKNASKDQLKSLLAWGISYLETHSTQSYAAA